MRTIGHHRPAGMPLNETTWECTYCGSLYYRSDLRMDMAGNLACPKDYGGDVVEIAMENAAGARQPLYTTGWEESGPFTPPVEEDGPVFVYPDGVRGF